MKIVVIGAGPTGLGVAYRLDELKKLNSDKTKDVELLILEQEKIAGGLSRTVIDENGFLWDMGVHVTFSHISYYKEAMKSVVDEWNTYERNCKVDMSHVYGETGLRFVPYPAQFAVPLFPDKIKQQCLVELKERYENVSKERPKNFEEWVIQNLGPTILEIFFKPYTRKVWTVEPVQMCANWVGERVAMFPQEKLESLCALNQDELKTADFGWGPNAFFNFPKYGGIGSVWKSMASKLPIEWIRYNSQVVNLDVENKQAIYYDKVAKEEVKISYDALVNCSPVDLIVKETKICPQLNVIHTKVFIVGVGLKLPMPDECKNIMWAYFPDPAVPFYRITFYSNYGEVTPDNSKYWSLITESGIPENDTTVTEEENREQTIEGLITKSIIKREQIVSVYSTTLPYGYPVPSVERDAEMARAHRVLEKNSIYSRGRFGGWKYESSNQDHCFIQGKEILDRVVLGIPEEQYKTGVDEPHD